MLCAQLTCTVAACCGRYEMTEITGYTEYLMSIRYIDRAFKEWGCKKLKRGSMLWRKKKETRKKTREKKTKYWSKACYFFLFFTCELYFYFSNDRSMYPMSMVYNTIVSAQLLILFASQKRCLLALYLASKCC